jgi:hypothetical protein
MTTDGPDINSSSTEEKISSEADPGVTMGTIEKAPPKPGDKSSQEKPTSPTQEVTIKSEKIEAVNITSTGDVIKNTTFKPARSDGHSDEDDLTDSFCDPTIRLPQNPSDLTVFHPPVQLNDFATLWQKSRLILLGGPSEEILSSTAYQLIERPEFKAYEKRFLSFDGINIKNSDSYIEMFLEYYPKKKMIVLVDIKNQNRFYDSIFTTRYYAKFIKEELEEKKILIIGLLDAQLIKLVEDKKNSECFFFTHWKIDFLPHLLKTYFPESFGELENKIHEQRKIGLWGKKNDEFDFYNQIKETLEKGIDFFKKRVEKSLTYEPSTGEMHDNLYREVEAQSIFKDEEPHKTVLFAGAFFSKLNPLDFHRLVRLLLEDKTVIVIKKTKIKSDESLGKIIETEEEIKAVEKWNKSADRILNDCHLKAVNIENIQNYIDFSHPYLRKDMKRYFKENACIYMRQQFLLVQNSGILFNSDISPGISDSIVHLAVQMAILNPSHYGPGWLLEFILQIKSQYDIIDKRPGYPFEGITQFLNRKENKGIRKHFYTQVSKLIREMLEHQQLKEVAKTFLDTMFIVDAHDFILHIVLNVGERMFPTRRSEFDMFYWLERLLNQGSEIIKEETYKALHQIAIEHHSSIYNVLEAIQEMLPSEEKEWQQLTSSNKFALCFIIHYCSGTVLQMEKEYYGAWPSKYALFHNMDKDDHGQTKRLKKIIQWLLHPLMERAVMEINSVAKPTEPSRFNFNLHAYLATLLEEWGLILIGQNIKKAHPEALELFKIVNNMTISNANKMLQRKIMFWLAEKNVLYGQHVTKKSHQKLRKRKGNSTRYDLVHMLFRLCKQIILTSKERKI